MRPWTKSTRYRQQRVQSQYGLRYEVLFFIERHCTPAVGPVLLAQTQCAPPADENARAGSASTEGPGAHSSLGAEARVLCIVRAARAAAEMHGVKATHSDRAVYTAYKSALSETRLQRTTGALYKLLYSNYTAKCIAIQLYTRYKATPLCLTPAHAPAPTRRWEYDREGEGIKRAPDRTGRRWV